MRLRNKLVLILSLLSITTFAQDIQVVLIDAGCNLCANGYGNSISRLRLSEKRKLTVITRQKDYYSADNAKETVRQMFGTKVPFDIVMSDSLVSALSKSAPVKYKENMGGLVYLKSGNRYDYMTTLALLGTKVDVLNSVETYRMSQRTLYADAGEESRRAFFSCPICTINMSDSSFYVLSVYGGTLSVFDGQRDTASTNYEFHEGNLSRKVYATIAGDTSGFAEFSSAGTPLLMPIGLNPIGRDEVLLFCSYYTVKKDSTGHPSLGGSETGLFTFRPSDSSLSLIPVILEGSRFTIQITNYIAVNDSQIMLQFSELTSGPKSGNPLFGLFEYNGKAFVFKQEINDFLLPKTKKNTHDFIPMFRNRYAFLPQTGHAVNCLDRKDVYQVNYEKVAKFIKKAYKLQVNLPEAWWVDYISTNPEVCRVIFAYADRLYVMFIDKSTGEVISGQGIQHQSIADFVSSMKMNRNNIYFVTRSGSVGSIRLD
jgi:hypothetical protein